MCADDFGLFTFLCGDMGKSGTLVELGVKVLKYAFKESGFHIVYRIVYLCFNFRLSLNGMHHHFCH